MTHVFIFILAGLNVFAGQCNNANPEATVLLQAGLSTIESKQFSEDFFEGPEKTLMMKFSSIYLPSGSLRSLSHESWRDVMQQMGIEILSKVESLPKNTSSKAGHVEGGCTAYLLSESSLFVYDDRVVFKTCGLSSPLRGVRQFLEVARGKAASAEEGLEQVLYSHPAYFRQQEQSSPHRTWEEERSFLKHLFPSGIDTRLGTPEHGVDLFAATFALGSSSTWFASEVYITDLEHATALSTFSSESKSTNTAFWRAAHAEQIDEFYFEPSGYSANILRGSSYATMHASPQASVSYVSHATNSVMSPEELKQMVDQTLRLTPGKHVGVFLFAFSPSPLSAVANNSAFVADGYARNGAWSVDNTQFQAALLSLTPQVVPTCTHGRASRGTSCMVSEQQLASCGEF